MYHTASGGGGGDVSHSVGRGDDVSHSVGRGMTYHTASRGDTQRPMTCHTDNNVHSIELNDIMHQPISIHVTLLTEHKSASLDYAQHNIERQWPSTS